MPSVVRSLLYVRNLFRRQKPEADDIIEEHWVADFRKQKNFPFDIKSEPSYDATLQKNPFSSAPSLSLGLKKTGCIAWVEAPDRRYRDLVISGTMNIDGRGGYGAGGICFRMVDDWTYYTLLISTKGYFRLDAMRNGMPFPLIGWTELPLSSGAELNPEEKLPFSIIVYGNHMVVLIRDRWAAEVSDASILEGTICLSAASYEKFSSENFKAGSSGAESEVQAGLGDTYRLFQEMKNPQDIEDAVQEAYTTQVFLDSLTVESRLAEVSAIYESWRESERIDSSAHLNLAETFTAMNQYQAAMGQIHKAWAREGHNKHQRELLLAGRLAQLLGRMADAEAYISQCFQMDLESPEGKEALTEMAKILYGSERYAELLTYCEEAIKVKPTDPILWTFIGHAHWNLGDHKKAAPAYERAFELDPLNGIHAKNAANTYEMMGRTKEALAQYLEAGKVFLKEGNNNDLGLLVPKFITLGETNWEARSLAGKWAFAVEDWAMAAREFQEADRLRQALRKKPPKDSAQIFLQALISIREGQRLKALPYLEEAAALEDDYALFHFRLAENIFLLDDNPKNPALRKALDRAIELIEMGPKAKTPDDEGLPGWIHNFAAQVALKAEDTALAAHHLEKARSILGDLPAVRVNQGLLHFLSGSLDEGLEVLAGDKQEDPEGILANAAGNLLFRSNRLDEADQKYRQALSLWPDNMEYLYNRAACLMELHLFGEADELLARALTIAPSASLLEMISYVAAKKGEYPRAEEACRMALEMDPMHGPSLLSLSWILITLGRQDEVGELLSRLDELDLKGETERGREELRTRYDELYFTNIACSGPSCERSWRVPKDPPMVAGIRLFAMPPDDLPAGTCLECGKTYCIGCAKEHLDSSGRFVCPQCRRTLRLVNEGLKQILHDWSASLEVPRELGKEKNQSAKALSAPESPQPPAKAAKGTGKAKPAAKEAPSKGKLASKETSAKPLPKAADRASVKAEAKSASGKASAKSAAKPAAGKSAAQPADKAAPAKQVPKANPAKQVPKAATKAAAKATPSKRPSASKPKAAPKAPAKTPKRK